MRVFKAYIILAGVLISAMSVAGASSPAKTAKSSSTAKASTKKIAASKSVESRAALEKKLEIFEHASANRELAGLTQVEHARDLEKQAADLAKTTSIADMDEYKNIQKKAGSLEKTAAKLYGMAAANFDKAAANRKMVANISKGLNKVEQYRSSEAYATNMKLQGSDAMRMAADACEAAAVAYDKADDPTEVASNSQMAATWLEKLAVR